MATGNGKHGKHKEKSFKTPKSLKLDKFKKSKVSKKKHTSSDQSEQQCKTSKFAKIKKLETSDFHQKTLSLAERSRSNVQMPQLKLSPATFTFERTDTSSKDFKTIDLLLEGETAATSDVPVSSSKAFKDPNLALPNRYQSLVDDDSEDDDDEIMDENQTKSCKIPRKYKMDIAPAAFSFTSPN